MRRAYTLDGICLGIVNFSIQKIRIYTKNGCCCFFYSKFSSLFCTIVVSCTDNGCAYYIVTCCSGNCSSISSIILTFKLVFILDFAEGLILCYRGGISTLTVGPVGNGYLIYSYKGFCNTVFKGFTEILIAVLPHIVNIVKVEVYVISILTYTTVVIYRIILGFGIYNICCNSCTGILIFGLCKLGNSDLQLIHGKAYFAECTLIVVSTADFSSCNIVACIGNYLNLVTALSVSKILVILNCNGIFAECCGNICMRYGITVNPCTACKFCNRVISLGNYKAECCFAGSGIIAPRVVN